MATPSPTIIAGLRQALKAHAPFAQMADADLDEVVRASVVRYFAAGETILAPAAGRPTHCYYVRQGTIRGERPVEEGAPSVQWEHDEGEMFPLGALLARRAIYRRYVALEDTFCSSFRPPCSTG